MIITNRSAPLILSLVFCTHFACKDDEKSEPAAATEPVPTVVVSGENPSTDSGPTGGTTTVLPDPFYLSKLSSFLR